jgi:metallo-beta-lactamase family protein
MNVRLHFHGAAGGVTGSCFRLQTPRASVLVDCGLFQGPKTLKELNYRRFPFDPKSIAAVLLTHAHVDHSGLLPKLMLAGFRGPIHATAGTRDLCAVMLPDAGGIQEHEVEQLNRRFQRRGRKPVEPIYTADDAQACMRQFAKARYGEWVEAAAGVRARWWDAGHILGSASIEIEVEADGAGSAPLRLLFSGDIGPGGSDFVADPQGPSGVDHLIMESTYGRIERPPLSGEERRRLLANEVRAAHEAGGPLVVPAFAVERTQELISDLIQLMHDGAAPSAPIFLDSPLAIRACEVFFDRGMNARGENPFAAMRASNLLHTTETAQESKALEQLRGWHIIIAASGMCDAGRIRHHLKRLLWRREVTVMLAGFQATGTLGRFLQEGQRHVRIQGEEIRVHATIRNLDVYSGHADGPALAAWAKSRLPVAGKVFLVHGEPDSRAALEHRLVAEGIAQARIETPELDDAFRLLAADVEAAPRTEHRLPPGAATQLDWHNARSQLLLSLDEALESAPDDAARAALLQDLTRDLRRAANG